MARCFPHGQTRAVRMTKQPRRTKHPSWSQLAPSSLLADGVVGHMRAAPSPLPGVRERLDASQTTKCILRQGHISGARFIALPKTTMPRGAAAKNIVWNTGQEAPKRREVAHLTAIWLTFKVTLKFMLKVFARLRSADAGRIVRDGNPGIRPAYPRASLKPPAPSAASLFARTLWPDPVSPQPRQPARITRPNSCIVTTTGDSALTVSRSKLAE